MRGAPWSGGRGRHPSRPPELEYLHLLVTTGRMVGTVTGQWLQYYLGALYSLKSIKELEHILSEHNQFYIGGA